MRHTRFAVSAVAVTALLACAVPAYQAMASSTNEGVCAPLDSGKIDTTGNPQAVTVKAPAGKVITAYCAKAGSINQGNGPEYITLAEPVTTLVVRHSSGKALSHYSLSYGDATPSASPSATASTSATATASASPSATASETVSASPSGTVSASPSGTMSASPTETASESASPSPSETISTSAQPFDWNWTYPDPTCDALIVTYPSDIPPGQSNDVNVRIDTPQGKVTLNYHNNEGTWSGTRSFVYSQHAGWPAGITEWAVEWVQVGGSNYHYGESFHNAPIAQPIHCRVTDDGNPETYDVPQAVTQIQGWQTSARRVSRGSSAPTTTVAVAQDGLAPVELQRSSGSGWKKVKSVPVTGGRARVVFPRERKVGTYRYRLVLPGTDYTTGAVTQRYRVKVTKH